MHASARAKPIFRVSELSWDRAELLVAREPAEASQAAMHAHVVAHEVLATHRTHHWVEWLRLVPAQIAQHR